MSDPASAVSHDPTLELARLLEQNRATTQGDGEVFSGFPALARVNPDIFGLAVRSVDGDLEAAGDDHTALTLQSVSKPFAWAEALSRFGCETVLQRVGVEPSGDRFDAVIRLEPGTGRPFNPMVNAGALAVASLFVEADGAAAPTRLLEAFGRWAGRPLEVDLEVALSERDTAHRNRAISWLLVHHRILRADVEAVLDLYLQQCAILADVRDLATMAATLAAGGRNPVTGEQVVDASLVPRILAVMGTCGLYDDSGRFAFEVGLPAKSGISGAMIAVAPGLAGLAAISPRLDASGHSVRGVRTIAATAANRGFHAFAPRARGQSVPIPDLGELEEVLKRGSGVGGRGSEERETREREPEGLAVAVAGVDGSQCCAGEVPASLSLQATANPFTWLLVANELGLEVVQDHVGVEPSGNPYHAIVLDTRTRRPFNPLGNAGAIAVCGLVPGAGAADRLAWLTTGFGRLAGDAGPLRVDAAVLAAERAHGARNRAIASLLRAVGAVTDEAAALELYLQQCSLRVTLAQLARMAAVLAAGGRDHNGEQLVDAALVPRLLALMLTCGLHDESGRAAWEIGLPMKSGISGALIAVVPGVCGIAAWSPQINELGTPVAARAAVGALAARRGWNVFAT